MPVRGLDGATDAAAEALAWAWEHWTEVSEMANPVGYLYRVGQTRTRARKRPVLLPAPATVGVPDAEPALVPALVALPDMQRAAVWLVHACGWRHAEVGEALDVTASTVATHVSRGMAALRSALGVGADA